MTRVTLRVWTSAPGTAGTVLDMVESAGYRRRIAALTPVDRRRLVAALQRWQLDIANAVGEAQEPEPMAFSRPEGRAVRGTLLVDLQDVTVDGRLSNVSLRVVAGEILGPIGRQRSGKTSVLDVIYGTALPIAGERRLLGHQRPAPRQMVSDREAEPHRPRIF